MEKREIALVKPILLLPQQLEELYAAEASEGICMWERVNTNSSYLQEQEH